MLIVHNLDATTHDRGFNGNVGSPAKVTRDCNNGRQGEVAEANNGGIHQIWLEMVTVAVNSGCGRPADLERAGNRGWPTEAMGYGNDGGS